MKALRLRTPARRILALLLAAVFILSILPVLPVWADTGADTTFTFSDSGIAAAGTGSGYSISGTNLSISAAGVYKLTGSCANGSVTVKASTTGVTLILDDLTLTSTSAGPIVCNKNTEVTIEAVGTSTLTETGSSSEGAGIKAKGSSKLTLTGSGILNVVGNIKNGIKGAAETEIIVSDLTLNIDALNNALASDGSIVINSGNLKLTAGNDAIKSEPETEDTASAGTVTVNGGTINVTAAGDGIQTTGACTITGGTFEFTTGGGYQVTPGDDSTKGIKSDTAAIISGGIFKLNCSDDAIHSNGDVTLTGGTYTLYTGDDAIHADYNLTIGATGTDDGPDITVASCYEGFEGAVITLYSGKGSIVSSDDGINAANSDLTNYNFKLLVYGGSWYINAEGDGVDSNGDVYLYGGVIESFGSTSSSDAALDFDGSCYALGGTILAVGMSGMAQAPTSGVYVKFGSSSGGPGQSGQPGQSGSSISIKSGSAIVIKDASGDTVYSATGIKSANSVVFASAALVAGQTYSLYIDGTLKASVTASGTSSTGTVSGVSISPSSVTMAAGESMIFTADVSGTNSPSQSVTWSVSGGAEGTVISSGGKLTIAEDETAETLTVTAVSTANQGKYATATVTVTEPMSAVTGVTVSPSAVTLVPGATQSFTVSVEGETSQSVTWKVEGGVAGTSIASDGTLTVSSDETAATLTVTATSTADASKFGTATVTIAESETVETVETVETHTVTFALTPGDAAATISVRDGSGTSYDPGSDGAYNLSPGTYLYMIQADGYITTIRSFTVAEEDLTVAVTLTSVGSGMTAERFSDIETGDWFYGAVDYIVKKGLFVGTGDTLFSPEGTMTRAMFVQVMAKLAGADTSVYTESAFSDVPADAWYMPAVQWAADNGIVSGVGGNQFDPDGAVTREQMAVILYQYIRNYLGVEISGDSTVLNSFDDGADTSDWALDAMSWITAVGVINGNGDGTVTPNTNARRAEVAAMLLNFIGLG